LDPNKTLSDIRAVVRRIHQAEDNDASAEDIARDAGELATLVQALDEWLTRGGFLPDAWRRSKP
jgi:hypothetical protein